MLLHRGNEGPIGSVQGLRMVQLRIDLVAAISKVRIRVGLRFHAKFSGLESGLTSG